MEFILAGNPGIIQAIEADIVKINTKINEGDPLFLNILQHKVGILVIDFASRIRIRINGKVSIVYPDGNFEIKIEQVFGNCPKYIQARRFEYKAVEEIVNKKLHPLNTLNKKQQNWISESDTFIIASASFEERWTFPIGVGCQDLFMSLMKNQLYFQITQEICCSIP